MVTRVSGVNRVSRVSRVSKVSRISRFSRVGMVSRVSRVSSYHTRFELRHETLFHHGCHIRDLISGVMWCYVALCAGVWCSP
jgi:hypothetical protein